MTDIRTFETFIVNSTNRDAYTICRNIAEGVDTDSKPVFIYGENGCGKTHLLRAMKHRLEIDGKSVLCIGANDVTNEMIRIIKSGEGGSVYDKLAVFDVIFIDNGQSVLGKPSMSLEVGIAISRLCKEGKRVVFVTDRDYFCPEDFGIDMTLIRINPPDDALKTEYVTRLLTDNGVSADKDTVDYILQKEGSSMTALKGAVNKILFHRDTFLDDINIKTII